MTQEEILEGNKLIAEFMGYDYFKNHYIHRDSNTPIGNMFTEDKIQYHSSFDWLMPVVEKIEALGYSVFIQNDCCWLRVARAGMKIPIITHLSDNKITSTYKAVIEFIKWYNHQKY